MHSTHNIYNRQTYKNELTWEENEKHKKNIQDKRSAFRLQFTENLISIASAKVG